MDKEIINTLINSLLTLNERQDNTDQIIKEIGDNISNIYDKLIEYENRLLSIESQTE